MKKTILHIIQDFGHGGAETMLVQVLKELTDYNNIVVTLFPLNDFADELKCTKYYCLNFKSVLQLPFATSKFKKIIKDNNVDIVHSHLFWPTVLARIATPKKIPLITTIHAFIASSNEYKYNYIRILDKLTYKLRKNIIIAVAEGAKQEYFSFLKQKPYKAYTLYTFVDTKIFDVENTAPKQCNQKVFKLVAVAALRKQKNFKYLLDAFRNLDNSRFQLDIYGEGLLHKELQDFICSNNLNINLMGAVKNIENILPQYDLFVLPSAYEGFSLSVLEAMAMRVPLLLSNITSFKEQCKNSAVYFDLNSTCDFAKKLNHLAADKNKLQVMADMAYQRAIQNFTLDHHMKELKKIYQGI